MVATTYVNLDALSDNTLTLSKYGEEITFTNRVPASLVPRLLKMVDDQGNFTLSPDAISDLFTIIVRIIRRDNPDMTEEYLLDWLELSDLVPIVTYLLNPPAQGSETTTERTPTPISRSKTRRSSKSD